MAKKTVQEWITVAHTTLKLNNWYVMHFSSRLHTAQLLNMYIYTLLLYVKFEFFVLENLNIHEKIQSDNNFLKLKNKDLVYIITFIDVHKIYVRKVDDETDELSNFIERVNLYCSEGIYLILIISITIAF